MIALASQSAALVQRLRARAARLAASKAAPSGRNRVTRAPTDWHSATALWPDFTGVSRDGK
ncbi:MAG: hypothetical protein NBV68_06915 [Erythrobacter sp.]|uniref:hypothetical protein n=1 Tax=Erythrobacter sp. TaxID=1042 RepID=UPI0025F90F46|nr:hypothetical protein [Erythrobacter sp.]MCL9999096.1 hypothetical protein [Erythrobacter sp.]